MRVVRMLTRSLLTVFLAVVLAAGIGISAVFYDKPDALFTIPDQRPILITGINVISMTSDKPVIASNQNVVIRNGLIAEINDQTPQTTQDWEHISGQGKYLIPGLIDAHIHLSDETELAGYLAHGVTGLRNMGGYPFHLRLIEAIARDEILSPDFVTTGPILNSPGPNAAINQQLVTTGDEARAAVQKHHAVGFNRIKVYSNLTADAFRAILEESNSLGLRVTGHSPEGTRSAGVPYEKPFEVDWMASVGQGFSSLEHTETIVWHALRDRLDDNAMNDVAEQLVASRDRVTPTLLAHRRLVEIALTKGAYLSRPDSDTINPLVNLVDQGSIDFWRHEDPRDYEVPHSDFFLKATGIMHKHGVPILAGTDSGGFGIIPGRSLARELELLVRAGLTPYEALRSATAINAESLGFTGTGTIAEGSRANLLILNENPLDNISTVENPDHIFLRGHSIDSARIAELEQAAKETSLTRSIVRAAEMLWFIR